MTIEYITYIIDEIIKHYLPIIAIIEAVKMAVICILIRYAAMKNSDYFDYDYLAEKIAEEIKKQQIRNL